MIYEKKDTQLIVPILILIKKVILAIFGKIDTVESGKYTRFIILGSLTYFLTFLQTYTYVELLMLSKSMAYGISQVVIFIINLILARYWVFKSVKTKIIEQGYKFFLAVAFFRFVDWCMFNLINIIFIIPLHMAVFLSMATVFPFKYYIYDKKVYG